jgi:hypothetical protein
MPRAPRWLTPTPPPERFTAGDWRNDAACADHPRLKPEAWDDTTDSDGMGTASVRWKRIAAAIKVCRTECPVRDACLADVDLRWDEGVRGGVDLRRLAARRGAAS